MKYQFRTHCSKGHDLVGYNLIIDEFSRKCRICVNEKNKRVRENRKALAKLRAGENFANK